MKFSKFDATGNDFIVIDGYASMMRIDPILARRICDRRRGIGADGLILITTSSTADIRVEFYNSDGTRASMCGNGGRVAACYAHDTLHIRKNGNYTIETDTGLYKAIIEDRFVELFFRKPTEVGDISLDQFTDYDHSLYLNTGVPHAVFVAENIKELDIISIAPDIRNATIFPSGTNVNFMEKVEEEILYVRTYDRGVEDEILSSGTGVIASAIAASLFWGELPYYDVRTKGGELRVKFYKEGQISLGGPVKKICHGEYLI